MRIKKDDVSNFVTSRINQQLQKVTADIKDIVSEEVAEAVTKYYDSGWGSISDDMSRLHDHYVAWLEVHKISEWMYRQPIQSLHTVMRAKQIMISNDMRRHTDAVMSGGIVEGRSEEINRALIKAQSRCKLLREKVKQLKKLSTEVDKIKKSVRSGNKLYDTFVSLGFNMSGFKPADDNLPAIVTISVDPAILDEQ